MHESLPPFTFTSSTVVSDGGDGKKASTSQRRFRVAMEVFLMTAATQGKKSKQEKPTTTSFRLKLWMPSALPHPVPFLLSSTVCNKRFHWNLGSQTRFESPQDVGMGVRVAGVTSGGDTGVRLTKIVVKIQTCKVGRNKKQSLRFCHAQPYTVI